MKKVPSNTCKMSRSRSFGACAKYHPGLCSPVIHSVVWKTSVRGHGRPWSDCADAQADLDLRCPHIPDDMFKHGTAHIILYIRVTSWYWINIGLSTYIIWKALGGYILLDFKLLPCILQVEPRTTLTHVDELLLLSHCSVWHFFLTIMKWYSLRISQQILILNAIAEAP